MIRLALIEAGRRVIDFASALPQVSGLQVHAVVDTDGDTARAAADQLNAGVAVASLEELLANHADAIDAVAIYAPIAVRPDLACQAAQAGKHLLVDAPLAATCAQADTAIEKCRSSAAYLQTGADLRFLPSSQTIRQRLDAGKLGDPGLVRLHHWRSSHDSATSFSALVAGEVDLVNWLYSARPELVFATAKPEDSSAYAQLHLGYSAGGMAVIDVSRTLPSGSAPYYSLTLIGAAGAAYADDHHNVQLLYHGGNPTAVTTGTGSHGLRNQLRCFAAGVAGEGDFEQAATETRSTVAVTAAAAASLEAQRPARLAGDDYDLI